MDSEILSAYYQKRGLAPEATKQALAAVSELEADLHQAGSSLETATAAAVRDHVAALVAAGKNSPDRLRALARYFYLTGSWDVYIYFTSLFGSLDVMENIRCRIQAGAGEAAAAAVYDGIAAPPLGAPLAAMPPYTRNVLDRLKAALPLERCRQLLAGNNHGISRESQLPEKAFLAAASSLDDYLADLHRRKVAELQSHCDDNKIWYEQIITQEVVDFVAANPEILSAVRDGNRLYITKIPYDTAAYLRVADPDQRKYCLCHCPFVRESLLDRQTVIDPVWCYCSGGFTKFPFDVLFDADLPVELLESPLLGQERCRFAITLPRTQEKE